MMADVKRKYLDKKTLTRYWTLLIERIKTDRKQEILYICHCTCIKARRAINTERVIKGGDTDLPTTAPLASNTEVQGTWFSVSSDILPRKSPYGSKRIVFAAHDLMSYLTDTNMSTVDNGSREPRLFFECAHYYGNMQYVRCLLVRRCTPDQVIRWCETSCKEINLRDNPLFEYTNGKIWSRARQKLTIDVLIVGDVHLDEIHSTWDSVGKSQRAGRDPIIGLL